MQAAPPAIYSHTGPLLGWNMAGCHLAARVSSPLAAIPQRAHAAWGEKCLEREREPGRAPPRHAHALAMTLLGTWASSRPQADA